MKEDRQPATVKLTQLEVIAVYLAGIVVGILVATIFLREEHTH